MYSLDARNQGEWLGTQAMTISSNSKIKTWNLWHFMLTTKHKKIVHFASCKTNWQVLRIQLVNRSGAHWILRQIGTPFSTFGTFLRHCDRDGAVAVWAEGSGVCSVEGAGESGGQRVGLGQWWTCRAWESCLTRTVWWSSCVIFARCFILYWISVEVLLTNPSM